MKQQGELEQQSESTDLKAQTKMQEYETLARIMRHCLSHNRSDKEKIEAIGSEVRLHGSLEGIRECAEEQRERSSGDVIFRTGASCVYTRDGRLSSADPLGKYPTHKEVSLAESLKRAYTPAPHYTQVEDTHEKFSSRERFDAGSIIDGRRSLVEIAQRHLARGLTLGEALLEARNWGWDSCVAMREGTKNAEQPWKP
jgi:hypothetical protein